MTERPIIFSAEMVRAILDGRKVQTRRVAAVPEAWPLLGYKFSRVVGRVAIFSHFKNIGHKELRCRYGVPGDRLWVRRKKDLSFAWKKADAFLWLEIVSVRVERLQDISWKDAVAEGCEEFAASAGYTPIIEYEFLWDKINGKKHSWASNPWVWGLEFKRVKA